MKWTVLWTASAAKDLRRIDARTGTRIHAAMGRFASTAQGDVKRLQGRDAEWRLRIGEWRAIFTLDEARKSLVVLRVRHRSSAYDT